MVINKLRFKTIIKKLTVKFFFLNLIALNFIIN